jgi:hypothetical protein
LALRKPVKQQLAPFPARLHGKNFPAKIAEAFEPWTNIARELLFDFTPQTLRNGGTLA